MANWYGPRLSVPKGIELYRRRAKRSRKINEQAGRALEVLGHAIDYLADEFLFEYPNPSAEFQTGRFEAIQLLMYINRQIYFECPEVPRLKDRILARLNSPKPSGAEM